MARDIIGVYDIQCGLRKFTENFTFSGNDRNVELSVASDYQLGFKLLNSRYALQYNAVSFIVQNEIKVKKMRLVTNLAPGLRAGNDNYAGRIALHFYDPNGGGYFDSDELDFLNYNEWVESDQVLRPYLSGNINPGVDRLVMMINHNKSFLSVDDYNIQADYIGQTFNVFLEMVIDTAGMIFNYTGGVI